MTVDPLGHETPFLRTERLLMRPWLESDREPFAALNADPEVMRFFPATQTRVESDAFIDRITESFASAGYGVWAVERRADQTFLGFVGLGIVPPVVVRAWPRHRGPEEVIEIGWRLARHAWHQGYATEAARAALRLGFTEKGLSEIVAFTAVPNLPSRAVMKRLAMSHDPATDFDHPRVPTDHEMCPHVLYRLPVEIWEASQPKLKP